KNCSNALAKFCIVIGMLLVRRKKHARPLCLIDGYIDIKALSEELGTHEAQDERGRGNNQSLEDIARLVNPSVRGWVNYYGRFYRSALTPVLRHLERALIRWACRKYKRLRRHYTNAAHWLGRVARRDPQLFVICEMGIR